MLNDLEQSEAASLLFQGGMRSIARTSVDGVAAAATIYVTHWKEEALLLVRKALNGLPPIHREPTLDLSGLSNDARL